MANPVLRKLSNNSLSSLVIADLIEKHIGNGVNEYHCLEAYLALKRIRNQKVSLAIELIDGILGKEETRCNTIKAIISHLRSKVSESK